MHHATGILSNPPPMSEINPELHGETVNRIELRGERGFLRTAIPGSPVVSSNSFRDEVCRSECVRFS